MGPDYETKYPLTILQCSTCNSIPTQYKEPQYAAMNEWSAHLYCTECTDEWWICFICKSKFTSWKSLQQHHYRRGTKHEEKLKAAADAADVSMEDVEHFQECTTGGDDEEENEQAYDDGGAMMLSSSFADDSQQPTATPPTSSHNEASPPIRPDASNLDWISKLGPDIGTAVNLDDDITALFDKEWKSPNVYALEAWTPGSGSQFLVAKAFTAHEEDISKEEAQFHLSFASLLTSLSHAEQEKLAFCLPHIANSHSDSDNNIFKRTRAPLSENDFQTTYLRGPTAIIPNLPHPVIRTTDDGTHAYVSLRDVIADMLGKGTPVDEFGQNDESGLYSARVKFASDDPCISQTKAAQELYLELKEVGDDFIMYLWIRSWSDDFDPSHTKSNRNQVWIKTYTICPPRSSDTGENTFLMALGSKGDDHEELEKIFVEELKALLNEGRDFFVAALKRKIRVKAGIVTTCVDRPERTKQFSIGDHNGSYSVVWGFAAKVDGSCKENHLPSCPFCRRKRVMEYFGLPHSGQLATRQNDERLDAPIADQRISSQQCNVNSDSEDTSKDDESSEKSSDLDNEIEGLDTGRTAEGTSLIDGINSASAVSTTDAQPAGICEKDQCSSWNLLDPAFTCATPAAFPLVWDVGENALEPPLGREITGEPNKNRVLPGVYLTLEWIDQAAKFAHHQLSTNPPNSHPNKRYWSKAHAVAYLRTCGFVNKLMNSIVDCAKKKQPCPTPCLWRLPNSLKRTHYAAMHMLFLGNVNSNFQMVTKWMRSFDLHTEFGRHVNKYLFHIAKMRLRRFRAHHLSSAKYGTGAWVSENYLFWARACKFFFTLPCFQTPRLTNDEEFQKQFRVVRRFMASQLAVVSRLMSNKISNEGMLTVIQIYLDAMVEMDRMLVCIKKKQSSSDEGGADDDGEGQQTPKKMDTAKPNWTKSNSLGVIAAAQAHDYFGPAILHWEGGFSGERKIQEVKPMLGIKRENAKWEKIVMRRAYQNGAMDWLLSNLGNQNDNTSRSSEGLYRIFSSRDKAILAVDNFHPLLVVRIKSGLHVLFRPTGQSEPKTTRSSVMLMEVVLKKEGEQFGGCWFSPLSRNRREAGPFTSLAEVETVIDERVLLLPRCDGHNFVNSYYAIGDMWTELVETGMFVSSELKPETFSDWIDEVLPSNSNRL